MGCLNLTALEECLDGDLRRVRSLRGLLAECERARGLTSGDFWVEMTVCAPPEDARGAFPVGHRVDMSRMSAVEAGLVRELVAAREARAEDELRALGERYAGVFDGIFEDDEPGDAPAS